MVVKRRASVKKAVKSAVKTFSLRLEDGTELFIEIRVTALEVGA
jgi:hypothetical protein